MRVPDMKNCPLIFLQDVLAGNKILFKESHTVKIKNPGWAEFSNAAVWHEARKNPDFMQYIPNSWTFGKGGRDPEKEYCWSVVCTLQPEWVHENIDRIRKARYQYQLDSEARRPPDTFILPEWVEKLLSVDFIPSMYNFVYARLVNLGNNFSDFVFPLENKKGKGVILHKAKAPVKPQFGKLSTRKKPPTYYLQQYEVVETEVPEVDPFAANVVNRKPTKTPQAPSMPKPTFKYNGDANDEKESQDINDLCF